MALESFRVTLSPMAYPHFGLRFPADMNQIKMEPDFLQFPGDIADMGPAEDGKQSGRLLTSVEITFPNYPNKNMIVPVNSEVTLMRNVGDYRVIIKFNPEGQPIPAVMMGGRRRSTRRRHRRRRQNTRRHTRR